MSKHDDNVSMRQMLDHGCVDLDILWDIVHTDLPPLIEQLQAILTEKG